MQKSYITILGSLSKPEIDQDSPQPLALYHSVYSVKVLSAPTHASVLATSFVSISSPVNATEHS